MNEPNGGDFAHISRSTKYLRQITLGEVGRLNAWNGRGVVARLVAGLDEARVVYVRSLFANLERRRLSDEDGPGDVFCGGRMRRGFPWSRGGSGDLHGS